MKLINREGSKYRYKDRIISLFPKHDCYIEGFLGTGAIFLNKPLAEYNILNDHSKFIYDLFHYLMNKPLELYKRVNHALIYDKIIHENQDKIEYQILKSLYSMYGASDFSIDFANSNAKRTFLNRLKEHKDRIQEKLRHAIITCRDIFAFLRAIIEENKRKATFVYLDPPYSVSRGSLADNKGWSLDKLEELIVYLKQYKWQYAISEYADPEVLKLFKKYELNIHSIAKSTGVNVNFGNTKYEILATSYSVNDQMINKNYSLQNVI
nr:DNA adenine methylase [Borrelia sp. BU AG58]